VLTIADLNSMIINAQVNQADVPRLKVGETVEVTVEAVGGLHATGTVERISPQAIIKNNIKGYPARIVLQKPDERIRPGMTAMNNPVASADNVTAVPWRRSTEKARRAANGALRLCPARETLKSAMSRWVLSLLRRDSEGPR
jgi:multidrug efflux pump subunit AcrA (membrane-fusion protein)